jgi:hypothetical protein
MLAAGATAKEIVEAYPYLEQADVQACLVYALRDFHFFYNHVRPHRHLDGATPAEAWAGSALQTAPPRAEYWFEGWDGLLKGYYLRR